MNPGDTVTLTSADDRTLANSLSISTTCGSLSSVTLAVKSAQTVTVSREERALPPHPGAQAVVMVLSSATARLHLQLKECPATSNPARKSIIPTAVSSTSTPRRPRRHRNRLWCLRHSPQALQRSFPQVPPLHRRSAVAPSSPETTSFGLAAKKSLCCKNSSTPTALCLRQAVPAPQGRRPLSSAVEPTERSSNSNTPTIYPRPVTSAPSHGQLSPQRAQAINCAASSGGRPRRRNNRAQKNCAVANHRPPRMLVWHVLGRDGACLCPLHYCLSCSPSCWQSPFMAPSDRSDVAVDAVSVTRATTRSQGRAACHNTGSPVFAGVRDDGYEGALHA
jgi:hypothetical protein